MDARIPSEEFQTDTRQDRTPIDFKRRFLAPVVLSFLVLLILFSYAIYFEKTTTSEDTRYEETLYESLYNAEKLGYNPDQWGGKVLYPGEKDAGTSLELGGLVLPVYAYEDRELEDQYAFMMMAKYFPEVDCKNIYDTMYVQLLDSEGCIAISNGTTEYRFYPDGHFTFSALRGYSQSGIDQFESIESVKSFALDYLELHGGVPDDIAEITVSGGAPWKGVIHYTVKIQRGLEDLRTMPFSLTSVVELEIDGTKREVMSMYYGWRELTLAFYITDLPSPQEVLTYHHLNLTRNNVKDWEPKDCLVYIDLPFDRNPSSSLFPDTVTHFLLPFWVAIDDYGDNEYCNAIFPECFSNDYD